MTFTIEVLFFTSIKSYLPYATAKILFLTLASDKAFVQVVFYSYLSINEPISRVSFSIPSVGFIIPFCDF